MPRITQLTLVVPDYDEAIHYYTQTLGFELLEDTPLTATKRWVRVAPDATSGISLLLAKAKNEKEAAVIGNQTGGRVFLFLEVEDFDSTYSQYQARGVTFSEVPRDEAYGKVVVFRDPYGNMWDLIERKT